MTFEKLIEELNAKLGVEIENAGDAFALDVDGETVVLQMAGVPDGDLLLMCADLGATSEGKRAAVASAALEANFLYQGTGGATLAMNPADAHLYIHRYDWLDRLDAEKALEALSRFADTAAAWRRILNDVPEAGAVTEPAEGVPAGLMV